MTALFVSICLAAGGDGVLYQSAFGPGAGLPEPWRGARGSFVVADDAVHVTSKRTNPVLRLDRSFEGDITVAARFRDADRCHWTGLLVRDTYRVTVNKQFGTFSLIRQESGKARTLATVKSYALYVYSKADFRMAVSLAGKRIRCALDGKTLIDVTDEAMPAAGGLAFLGGWGTDVRVSDIVVRRGERLGPIVPEPKWGADLIEVTSARFDRADAIYSDGMRPVLSFGLRNRTGEAVNRRIRLRLIDYWGREVALDERPLRLAARAQTKDTWQVLPKRRGSFKVALDLADERGAFQWVQDLASCSVIPDASTEPDPTSVFGGHFEQGDLPYHIRLGQRIGAKWVRFHDIIQWTWWLRVEPVKGEFRWCDANVDTVAQHGFTMLGEFLHTPAWATSAPKGTNLNGSHYAYSIYPPKSLDDFADYVYRTVDHYKRRIHAWEVWNEPHYGGFWKGTPEEYAALCKAAYQAAKRADPKCTIVGGGGVDLGHLDWVERAVKAGLAEHLDAFSIHGLHGPTTVAEMNRQDARLARLRRLLARDGKSVPIWNSETSFPSTSFLDQYRGPFRDEHLRTHYRHAAEDVARLYASNMAQGIEHTFHYFTKRLPAAEYRKHPINLDVLDVGGVLKPMGVAYATTARVLAKARFHKCQVLSGPAWLATFQRGRDTVAVWWALSGGESSEGTLPQMILPKGSTLVDLMGNESSAPSALPVSREPRFLLCPNTRADDLAKRIFEAGKRNVPSPLAGEGQDGGEGEPFFIVFRAEHAMFTPTLALPRQGGGDSH